MRLLLATAFLASLLGVATPGVGAVRGIETTRPVFSGVPPPIVVKVNGVKNAIVSYEQPVARDDASGVALPVTCSPPSGSAFELGDTDVTCTAVAVGGTEAFVSFVVRVLDTVLPPAATDVVVRGADAFVKLTWRLPTSKDVAGTEIVRYPGALVIFRGPGRSFTDTAVRQGGRYRYVVASYDWANNRGRGVEVDTTATNAKLIEPQDQARLTLPPLLAWARVAGADYYNVQLWAVVPGGPKKVLSIWPISNHLQLASKWVFGGQNYELTKGKYRWYVWPGLGQQVLARYGGLIGSRVFVIVG